MATPKLWEFFTSHLTEIIAFITSAAFAIRWLLMWHSAEAAKRADRQKALLQEGPQYFTATLHSLQEAVDFYNSIVQDCKRELAECRHDIDKLKAILAGRTCN